MLNIVLSGPPGAGKGTQSEKIVGQYQLIHISTGELFRKHINEETPIGAQVKKYINEGQLVPDKFVMDMVEEKIKEHSHSKGLLFDGFPRTVAQAEMLDKKLTEYETSISGMITLTVPEEELIQRIKQRRNMLGRIDDQKVATRINVYLEETLPVAAYYKSRGKLFNVNGVGAIEAVFARITTAIDRLKTIDQAQ
ncbi:MAG: adenylate kinase [Cytophagales bacterium]|nr:adenylate kinase [Cytophagales bacterium]